VPTRQYVYAVVPSDIPVRRLADQRGIEDQPLRLVTEGSVAAIVSPTESERVRPTRAALRAHEEVAASAHRSRPVVPVRFGSLFPDADAVARDLLAPNRLELEELLETVRGKDEFRLRARYLSQVALRDVVARYPEVQRLRRRLASLSGGAERSAGVQLGEMVMAGLEALREEDAANIMDEVGSLVAASEQLADRSEDTALHAAFLVDRSRIGELEGAIERVAKRQRERLQLELTGPLPPWDFTVIQAGAA
jgi:hypothetical protein